jgi:hypothetical protein
LRAIDRADRWPDDVRLFDIEGRFTCTACGKRGADVRPDFNWSAGWAIAKAITGLTNCRSQPLKKRWRARNDVAL